MLHSALPPAEDLTLAPLADIARGGMGMVQLCRATDGRLSGRALAVKRLNPALEDEPEFINMFLDETWITATINNPHVVKVEAWGRDEQGLFLAVELVEGVSLSRLVKESRAKHEPFAERTVAHIASQICSGLGAAHGLKGEGGTVLGLVHRDLTPGNILVSFQGMVKIADFGIAKAEERLTSTRIGMMKGKPAYMAPEQARGGGIDGRADLFALGVVIYELLAGRRPWIGTNDLETLVAVTTTEAPKLAEVRKTSPVFVEIVEKCLQKSPAKRFSSALEIKQLLDGWRRERGFESDDDQSLAAFVQRNTPQQQTWFEQALSGALARGGQTFMDLEAGIDKSRKKDAVGTSGSYPGPGSVPLPTKKPLQVPQLSASQHQPLPVQSNALSGPDDEAKTQFLDSRASSSSGTQPAAAMGAGGQQGWLQPPANPPRALNSTVALTPEETAAMSARFSSEASHAYHGYGGHRPPSVPPTSGGTAPIVTPQRGSAAMSSTVLADPQIMVERMSFGDRASFPQVPPTLADPRPRGVGVWLVLVLLLTLGAGALYYFVLRPRYGL